MATEKRLIDANALSNDIPGISKNMKRPEAVELACLLMIAEAAPVDAVEVVRCENCRWRKNGSLCYMISGYGVPVGTGDDFFCAYGERRPYDH